MAFYAPGNPPSPPTALDAQIHGSSEVDALSSALHSALHPFTNSTSGAHGGPSQADHPVDMHPEKSKSSLDISFHPETVYLKGTGPNVDPTLLTGHVSLYLTESTSIKQITLSFRGKARLPIPSHEPYVPQILSRTPANKVSRISLNSSTVAYSLCNHEWSFLEGKKGHSHTLKAGRHLFPFQLQIGGSLPSSMQTVALGGASIAYKLHAVAVRPGLAHNLQAVTPVTVLRTFSPDALEYQQTLEIENTWPEKLMYSLMIPHKAWAVGDKITALAKFSPLAKGARVLSVVATIQETTKVYGRAGVQENTRVVATARHEIVGHNAVSLEESHERFRGSPSGSSTPAMTPALAPGHRSSSSSSMPGYFAHHTAPSTHSSASIPEEIYHNHVESDFDPNAPSEQELNAHDVVTHLSISIPPSATPTHALEPLHVSHRLRWSILIANRDGHTSELRCSLPLHLLDRRLLTEAQTATFQTRRLLLGGPDLSEAQRDEQELPSYRSHVYDRVANQYMPDAATRRITNPWVHTGTNPVNAALLRNANGSVPFLASGSATPLDPHPLTSQLPPHPHPGASTPLEWVNSELLLSLSQEEPPAPADERVSPPHSGGPSHPASRRGSRAPSPDRSPASPRTYVHAGGAASRHVQSVLAAQMKPLSALSSSGWLSSRSGSHANLGALTPREEVPAQSHTRPALGSMPGSEGAAALHRAFTEVPDYGVAARGFLGGVPPLSSMQGLPSYDEASSLPSTPGIGSPPRQAALA
ncbi:hypothetical protein HWV62_19095 [Athelia sp. TMB]|nr:hypothetical protein HWV62_19095 [Athelia sp. TMB]